jgi:amidase
LALKSAARTGKEIYMRLDEYTQYDATGLSALVRSGEVSPTDLGAAFLAAVERVNPELNAVIETFPDRAASASGKLPADAPFAGVPFLIKDIGATEQGTRCECGSRLAAGYVAPADTDLTRQWRAAGLNILGRTTTPELGFSCTTESVLYGPTCNPWDSTRMTGGSSGGQPILVLRPRRSQTDARADHSGAGFGRNTERSRDRARGFADAARLGRPA